MVSKKNDETPATEEKPNGPITSTTNVDPDAKPAGEVFYSEATGPVDANGVHVNPDEKK